MTRIQKCAREVLVIILWLGFCTLCEACPTCRDGITDAPHHASVVRGYFWSILFMMSMPFVIFGSLATYFYCQVRRTRSTPAITDNETATDLGSA